MSWLLLRPLQRLLVLLWVVRLLVTSSTAQSAAAGEAEAQRCRDRIESVRRDVFAKYDDALAELLAATQKTADLDGALAIRAERARIAGEQTLSEKDFVSAPKALHALQVQTSGKLLDLLAQLVADSIPKLVELKRQLTVAGKLDEAVSVRTAIEQLQNQHLPAVKVESGTIVSADNLITAYNADRSRADKIYKGQKIIVHGVIGGFRVDTEDPKNYHVFVTSVGAAGWIQCSFSGADHRFREEKAAYGTAVLLVIAKDGDIVRIQKGNTLDMRGVCEGWDESVRLTRCDLAR